MSRRAFPARAVHLDFHTLPGIPDLGGQFDPDEFSKTLRDAGVEYINMFAKCNLGFAYYPTNIGKPYPGMRVDLLGGVVEACHKYGIGVCAYFNAGLDHEHMLRHREWCRMNVRGEVCEVNTPGHFYRMACFNTGYKEHIIGMIREVVDAYPVDGIFLDCIVSSPCYGIECIEDMN